MNNLVYLHIGLPKSGTTFLQEVLWGNLDRLRELGFSTAADSYVQHVRAAADLADLRSGDRTVGAWDRQVALIAGTEHRVIMSQESLCLAGESSVARAIESLAPRPVTVVVTARDLARQISSWWQQEVKERYAGTMTELAAAIAHRRPAAERFWQRQDLLVIVDRWLRRIPAERVVVVTVPGAGAPPDLLWRRFAAACGLEPTGFDLDVPRPNESLGGAQVELLRRLNAALGERLTIADGYLSLVRRVVANELLAGQVAYERFGVDEPTHAWATAWADECVRGLRQRGVRVVGDLAELVPEPWVAAPDPATTPADAITDAAIETLAAVLVEWNQGRRSARRGSGRARNQGARRRPGPATSPPQPSAGDEL